MIHETFWTLLRDPAHWAFEIFLMLLFDGLLFGLCWPFVRKHWRHHIDRDVRDDIQAQLPDWSMNVKAIESGHMKEAPAPRPKFQVTESKIQTKD